jgi:hypothetical protein
MDYSNQALLKVVFVFRKFEEDPNFLNPPMELKQVEIRRTACSR